MSAKLDQGYSLFVLIYNTVACSDTKGASVITRTFEVGFMLSC